MNTLKKFWMLLIAVLPISAGALTPWLIGGLTVATGIIGVSVWRSVAPVNLQDAFSFFSSCWTCQMFSDIMLTMSNILPGIYKALGHVIIPMSVTLLAIFIAWRLFSGFLNGKMEESTKILGNFSSYVVKAVLLISLLLIPLPRLITSVLVEPAVSIGTSLNYAVSGNDNFTECMIATAVVDPISGSANASKYGAFSPALRHQLACEVSNVHQITGLGMTVGWTLLNMAFDQDYMYTILPGFPIFPNIPMILGGLFILALYLLALLPIPLYFLEVFITLAMDLIMLPLMLMAWMFDEEEFAIFPKGGKTIRQMIDDCLKAIVGIGLTVVFLTFAVMFLDAAFGSWNGYSILQQAMQQNDSKFLIDNIILNYNGIITLILMGVFIAMFMTMIPQLTQMLFKIKISDKYYQTAKNDINNMWKGLKKLGSAIKK